MNGISPADKVAIKASIPTKQSALKDSRSAASLPGFCGFSSTKSGTKTVENIIIFSYFFKA